MLKVVLRLFLISLLVIIPKNTDCSFRTTLNKADPNPLYNTMHPFEPLFENYKDYRNRRICTFDPEFISFSASPFFQQASSGSNACGRRVELGDLTGRFNMLALLPFNETTNSANSFSPVNTLTDVPSTTPCKQIDFNVLQTIRNNLLTCIENVFVDPTTPGLIDAYPPQLKTIQGLLSLQDGMELLGFFSVPIKYKKTGVRFEANALLWAGFGMTFDVGVSNVYQCGRFVNMQTTSTCFSREICLTALPTNTISLIRILNPFSTTTVSNTQWGNVINCINNNLMNNLQVIAQALNIDLCAYNKTSIEDVHAELFWRNAFCFRGATKSWDNFLFIPFFHIGVTLATGQLANPNVLFSLANGNNGHDEGDFLAGFGMDFADTIEVGGHAGFTHFRGQQFNCLRAPTNIYQNGLLPYQTSVCIKPGNTWHIGAFMNARYFYGHWSCWANYAYIDHQNDCYTILGNDLSGDDVLDGTPTADAVATDQTLGVFQKELLECRSGWVSQVLNVALNYDPSPCFQLGALIQIPLARKNAYRSSTFLASINIIF